MSVHGKALDHPANQIHSTYVSDATERELPVAYLKGSRYFKIDATKKKKWVFPEVNECVDPNDIGSQRGAAQFAARVKRWNTKNVFSTALLTSAAAPFTHKLNSDGWDDSVESLIQGKGPGLDGQGATLAEMHRQVFEAKLWPGISFLRIVISSAGQPIWVHANADSVLAWTFEYTEKSGVIITSATVEDILSSGKLKRTLFELVSPDPESDGSGGVFWKSYISKETVGIEYLIYAPNEVGDLQFTWEDFVPTNGNSTGEGMFPGLLGVPIAPFCTNWANIMRSPPPFLNAAELQLEVDTARSHLKSYRYRKSASTVFVASNLGEDENQKVNAPAASGHYLGFAEDGKGSWEFIDSEHVPQELDLVTKDEDSIRIMCMDPLRSQYVGDLKALETEIRDVRTLSWLELCMMSDKASLIKLLNYTSQILNKASSEDATITVTKVQKRGDKKDLVDRFHKFTESATVPGEVFDVVLRENEEGITAKMWEEIEPLLKAFRESQRQARFDKSGLSVQAKTLIT